MKMRASRALYALPLLASAVVWTGVHGGAASPQRRADAGKYNVEVQHFTANLRAARAPLARELGRAESEMTQCPFLVALPDRRKLPVIDAVFNHVLFSMLMRPFASFATRLHASSANGAPFASGVRAWTEVAQLLAQFPAPRTPLCASVRKWVKSHFAPAAAPVYFARIRTAARLYGKLERRLTRVARRLRKLGLSAAAARGFTAEAAIAVALNESQ